jgi:hypothetical protein
VIRHAWERDLGQRGFGSLPAGAKVVRHAKAVTFQLAEVAVPRAWFAAILERIGRLRAAPSLG